MNTQEIKLKLSAKYPNEIFIRISKITDTIGYTHRVFSSPKRILVVTTCCEDELLLDIVEVPFVPSKKDLKDPKRSWIPNGPLFDYYYQINTTDGNVIITDKNYYNATGFIDDSDCREPYITFITKYSSLMESIFELPSLDESKIRNYLNSFGATEKQMV